MLPSEFAVSSTIASESRIFSQETMLRGSSSFVSPELVINLIVIEK